LRSWEIILLLQLGLKTEGLTLPNISLTTHAPFTFAVLYNVPMVICLDWVMLDLLGRLGLAGMAARGFELAGLSHLRQAHVVVSRKIPGANHETPLHHAGHGVLVDFLDGVLPLGTRRVVPLEEHWVLVGAENRRAVVANTVEAVQKPGRQRLVQKPRHTAKRVALRLANSVKMNHPREIRKTLRQRRLDVSRALRLAHEFQSDDVSAPTLKR